MSNFLGQYLHAIDEKGRVPLPAKFRNGDGNGAYQEFVAARGLDGCLHLYPRAAWTAVGERLQRLRRTGDPENRRRAVAIMAQAADLVLDKHGRLSLPQPLMELAGLDREALFVGAGEVIQLWNPARFSEFLKLGDLDYDTFAATVL